MKICQSSLERTRFLPSFLRNQGEDDHAHPLHPVEFRACLRGTESVT